MGLSANQYDRRGFIKKMAAGTAAAGAMAMTPGLLNGASRAEASTTAEPFDKPGNHNLAWVWQFDDDGSPWEVRDLLAFLGMGILLKSHDATTYMSKWDRSGHAIDGPAKIRELREFFESGGVPFHCWAVVKGQDPIGEAHMAAEVLANGARSMVFDLEPSDGGSFWQGTPDSALRMGAELRSIARNGFLSVAPDPRPWQVDAVPCREFASFCNEIQPQTYWPMFNSSANYRYLRERGFYVPPEGVTPEVIIDVTQAVFKDYGLPIKPVGSGNSPLAEFERFVGRAHEHGMSAVSIWRFGTARDEIWDVFRRARPLYNAYYGPDWSPEAMAQSAKPDQPKLATLPEVTRAQRDARIDVSLASKEATTGGQGVTQDQYAPAKTNIFSPQAAKPGAKQSFWANPLGSITSR